MVNVWKPHYPVAAQSFPSDRFQPFCAVARTGLGVRSSPELGLLRRSKGQRAG